MTNGIDHSQSGDSSKPKVSPAATNASKEKPNPQSEKPSDKLPSQAQR